MSERSAVIVGAGTGTGAEVARTFAGEGYGVAVARRNEAPLAPLVSEIEAGGGRALAVAVDAGDEAAVAELFDRAEAELGPVGVDVSATG